MDEEKATQNSIVLDIVLTLVTLGLWNLWVQIRQINTVNTLAGEEVFFSPLFVFILSIFTLGIYFCYHEYRMTKILHKLDSGQTYFYIEIPIGLLTFIGIWIITDSYQQELINRIISKRQ